MRFLILDLDLQFGYYILQLSFRTRYLTIQPAISPLHLFVNLYQNLL